MQEFKRNFPGHKRICERQFCNKVRIRIFYREADHEASEANDDGLVDEDVLEVKDESSFDERLGGSSATLLSR